MTVYSVADAKGGLPRLIDRALEGEEVIISRHGRPVAELRGLRSPAAPGAAATYAWLSSRRVTLGGTDVTSVEVLEQMYEDGAD